MATSTRAFQSDDALGELKSLVYAGRFDAALKMFEAGLTYYREKAEAWAFQAWALASSGRWNESLEAASRGLQIDPDSAQCWVEKAAALHVLQRFSEALVAYEKHFTLTSDHSICSRPPNACWPNMAATLIALSRYNEALAACSKAIRFDQENAIAWAFKGLALNKLLRFEESVKAFDQALELNPTMDWVTSIRTESKVGRGVVGAAKVAGSAALFALVGLGVKKMFDDES